MSVVQGIKSRLHIYRNPVYLVYALIGLGLLFLTGIIAESGAGDIESAVFRYFNGWNDGLIIFWFLVSIFGTIGMVILIAIVASIRNHYATAFKVLFSGFGAYYLAYALKTLDIRPRPVELLANVHVREDSLGTFGFPSGHAAVITVLAMMAYQIMPRRWHKPVTILAVLVMLSRLYLGVHFPLDLIGGFAVGLICGGIVSFLMGSDNYRPVPVQTIKRKLKELGVKVKTAKIAKVDARGSTPYFVTLQDDSRVFVKVVGRENTIADWLFKGWRKVVYRRLEDETPFMGPKRQLEHEAYVSSLALLAGVRTPQVIGIFEAQNDRWAHAQKAIEGSSLDGVSVDQVTDAVLADVWSQVAVMHNARIVHRDLRAANVFLDVKGRAWLIDFGFAEAASVDESKHRDNAELIASTATLIGAERAVKAALTQLSKAELIKTGSYLSYAVVSSATAKELKRQKNLLKAIHAEIGAATNQRRIKPIEIRRVNIKTMLVVASLGVAIYVLIPQLGSFNDSFMAAKNANLGYIGLGMFFSALTYVFAGYAYKFIAMHPLKIIQATLVQVASSFASKVAPAGTGGIAVNTRYLYKAGHDTIQSGSIALLNTLLGFAGHISVLILVSLIAQESVTSLLPDIHVSATVVIIAVLALITVIVTLRIFPGFRKFIHNGRKKIFGQLTYYRHNLSRVALGYASSILITLAYSATLYMSAHALGVTLSALDVVYVFTIGAIAATVTPTPGGLGGTEAAYVASLVSLGVDSGVALAVTLLYRLFTFWLPIIPGFFAFRYATKRDII